MPDLANSLHWTDIKWKGNRPLHVLRSDRHAGNPPTMFQVNLGKHQTEAFSQVASQIVLRITRNEHTTVMQA